MKKITVGVLFGGKSTEHEVSIRSAKAVIAHLDHQKYEVVPLAISRNNLLYSTGDHTVSGVVDAAHMVMNLEDTTRLCEQSLCYLNAEIIDVMLPVLHGNYGEDGRFQGLFDLLNIPYVGSSLRTSAVAMDKDLSKRLVSQSGIDVAPWMVVSSTQQYDTDLLEKIIFEKCGWPCFIKPANNGSSVGVVKCSGPEELEMALKEAFVFDTKVLIEQAVNDCREVEVAVKGAAYDPSVAGALAEIIVENSYYDYEHKYADTSDAKVVIPAELPKEVSDRLKRLALQIYTLLEADGLSRIDFFVTKDHRILFNEINTLPGFTPISAYAKMWERSGVTYSSLLDELILLALSRHRHMSAISYHA